MTRRLNLVHSWRRGQTRREKLSTVHHLLFFSARVRCCGNSQRISESPFHFCAADFIASKVSSKECFNSGFEGFRAPAVVRLLRRERQKPLPPIRSRKASFLYLPSAGQQPNKGLNHPPPSCRPRYFFVVYSTKKALGMYARLVCTTRTAMS